MLCNGTTLISSMFSFASQPFYFMLQLGLRLSFRLQPLLLFPNLGRKEGFKRSLHTAGMVIRKIGVGIVHFFEEGENPLFCDDERLGVTAAAAAALSSSMVKAFPSMPRRRIFGAIRIPRKE
jgi:hypothetical protein